MQPWKQQNVISPFPKVWRSHVLRARLAAAEPLSLVLLVPLAVIVTLVLTVLANPVHVLSEIIEGINLLPEGNLRV